VSRNENIINDLEEPVTPFFRISLEAVFIFSGFVLFIMTLSTSGEGFRGFEGIYCHHFRGISNEN
jgi:hypothetical protein